MLELRRVRAGIFKENGKEYPSVNLYDFEKAVEKWKNENDEKELRKIIIPAEVVAEVYPVVFAKKESLEKLFNGSPLHFDQLEKKKQAEEAGLLELVNYYEKEIKSKEEAMNEKKEILDKQ